MGVVYRARDTKLDREVALKILPDDVAASMNRRQRFEREVKAIAALNHPNVVTIHAVEETGGRVFYTMELVDGPSLAELIPEQGLPLTRYFEIALALTDAVDCAHKHGITHRDLKPANIVIDGEGRLKVLDFGLAKLLTLMGDDQEKTIAMQESITGEGRIVGTVAYMSPEQAESKATDHRSDLFSLGIILYEMATGQRPFRGDTPISTVSSIIKDSPAAITDLNRSLPRHLGRIVKRCLSKDPGRRYQTARDLHNDLLDLREEINSGELDLPAHATAKGRPRPRVWQLLSGAFVVAVIALAANRFLPAARNIVRDQPAAASVMEITPLTRSGNITQASLSPDGKYLAYIRTDGRQRSLRLKQIATGSDMEIVPPGEGLIADPRISPGGDFIYYHVTNEGGSIYRVPLLGGRARRIVADAEECYALSPDGETIAFNRLSIMDRQVMLADVDGTGTENLVTFSVLTSHELAISPDGREVAVGKLSPEGIGDLVVAVPMAGGPERALCDETWNDVSGLAWLPDGSGILIAGARGLTQLSDPVQIWLQTSDGRELLQLTRDLNSYGSLSLAQRGQLLAAVQTRSRIAVCTAPFDDPDQVHEVAHTSNAGNCWDQVSWTPDGRILYEGPHGGALHIWDANPDGSDAQRVTTAGNLNMATEVSRDGNHIVYFSDRTGSVRIWIADRDGGNPRLLAEGGCDELWPQFTPDGHWVYYLAFYPADNVFAWRKVPVAGGPSTLLSDIFVYDWAFSPDGERIAMATPGTDRDTTILRIMSADLTETIASYECDYRWPSILRWLPDGSGVAYTIQAEDSRNIWIHPLDGSAPWQLTHRTSGTVMGFDFSPDGDSLGYSWLESTSDVVLLRNFRGTGQGP